MQTLFKPNLFSNSSSKVGAKNFVSGGKKLGSSIVGAAKNNIIGFNRTAQAMMPEKKEEKESSFIKNYTNFFGSKKTEKILRKNLKLVRDSLVNTFEIARHLKAAIISISGGLKGGAGKGGGGLFGGFMDAIKTFLTGAIGGALIAALPFLLKLAAIGSLVGIGLALWKSERFRDATLEFIKKSAEFIWENIKSFAMAAIKWMFGETEHSKEVKQSLNPKVINANIKEHGAEKTLEMLRDQYARDKESGFLDSVRAKRDGIEDEYIRRMTDVERKLAKEQGTKNIVSIMEKEVHIRKEEIRKERNNSPELKAIIASKDKKAYDAYRAETVRLMKETEKEIRDKYQQILLKGADGGSIHESMIEGKKWEGSTAFNQRTSSSSVSSDSNSEVNAATSDLTSMNFDNFYDDGSLDESKFSFAAIPFDLSQAQAQDSSGGITNTSGGISPTGNAVTFYSSSNSDPSYHKLNALMTFNIV